MGILIRDDWVESDKTGSWRKKSNDYRFVVSRLTTSSTAAKTDRLRKNGYRKDVLP